MLCVTSLSESSQDSQDSQCHKILKRSPFNKFCVISLSPQITTTTLLGITRPAAKFSQTPDCQTQTQTRSARVKHPRTVTQQHVFFFANVNPGLHRSTNTSGWLLLLLHNDRNKTDKVRSLGMTHELASRAKQLLRSATRLRLPLAPVPVPMIPMAERFGAAPVLGSLQVRVATCVCSCQRDGQLPARRFGECPVQFCFGFWADNLGP